MSNSSKKPTSSEILKNPPNPKVPKTTKVAKVPTFSNAEDLQKYARKTLLPLAIKTYLNLISTSKDEKMVKASADALVDLSSVKTKEGNAAPAFQLNFGKDFLENLKGGLEKVVTGDTLENTPS